MALARTRIEALLMLESVDYRGHKLGRLLRGKTVKVKIIQINSILLHASKQAPQVKEISEMLGSLSGSQQCNTSLLKNRDDSTKRMSC